MSKKVFISRVNILIENLLKNEILFKSVFSDPAILLMDANIIRRQASGINCKSC